MSETQSSWDRALEHQRELAIAERQRELAIAERQAFSSVEVTRGQRGTYGWQVKVYVPLGDEDGLVDRVVEIEALLRARFGDSTPAATDEGTTES